MENLSIVNDIQVIFKMYNNAKDKNILIYSIIENVKNKISFKLEKFTNSRKINRNINLKKKKKNFLIRDIGKII